MTVFRLVLAASLAGCVDSGPPPRSFTPPPSTDTSFHRSSAAPWTGAKLASVVSSSGERVLFATTGLPGGPGHLDRLVPSASGWEVTGVVSWEVTRHDLAVLDSTLLGHEEPVVYADRRGWSADDSRQTDYLPPLSGIVVPPVPCGDLDGDGLADRCHGTIVRFAAGGEAELADFITAYRHEPTPAAIVGRCAYADLTPGPVPRSEDCGDWIQGSPSVYDRDVDGDGIDDILSSRGIHTWEGQVLASTPSGSPGELGDLDGDGVLDLVKAHVADDDHPRRWLGVYRGPLTGDLTPDVELMNPCHVPTIEQSANPFNGWASFGSSLEFMDADGDGVDDIIANAPMCDGGRVFAFAAPLDP